MTVIRDRTKPRVLQLVLSLSPGGAERLVVQLATALWASIPMAVCCLDGRGAWAEDLADRGIPVVALDRSPGFRPTLAISVAREVRRHGATVLHCHQYSPFVYGSLSSGLRHGARVIYTEHGRLAGSTAGARRRAANRVLGRVPSRLIAVSRELRQSMIDEGFPEARVAVVSNGVELPRADRDARARARASLALPSDAPVVGTVARLDPVKDLSTLVSALALMRAAVPNAILLVVGDGPMRSTLEALARDRVPDGVRFLGFRADVAELLPALDIYANSSIGEGLSLTILEAMAASLPVVATRVGGTPEAVEHDVSGVLVPPRDAAALAAALTSLAADASRRASMGSAGRRRVERYFTLDRMTRDYRAMYEELSA
jgi:glycosyltransferase involved in cell wall biosynthesis